MTPPRSTLPWTAVSVAVLAFVGLIVAGIPLGSLLTLGLLLMCPLLMAGMHSNHTGHDRDHRSPRSSDP